MLIWFLEKRTNLTKKKTVSEYVQFWLRYGRAKVSHCLNELLIPKLLEIEKRDCAWGCARGINTTWENLQIEKHKSVRWAERTPPDLCFSIWRFSQVVFIPRAQPHAQSLFLFPIVFGINLIHFVDDKKDGSAENSIACIAFWQAKVQTSSPISALLRWRHFRLTLSLSLSLSLCISLSHRAHLTHNIGSASALPIIALVCCNWPLTQKGFIWMILGPFLACRLYYQYVLPAKIARQ